jgi:hypothetical protein
MLMHGMEYALRRQKDQFVRSLTGLPRNTSEEKIVFLSTYTRHRLPLNYLLYIKTRI